MTLDTKCFTKSVLSDWVYVGIGIVTILFVYVVFNILVSNADQISHIGTFINSLLTALNWFIVFELLTIVIIPLIATSRDPDKTEEVYRKEMMDKNTTVELIMINSIILFILFLFYCFSSFVHFMAGNGYFQDILPLFAGFLIVNAIITCPVAVAYARCNK